MLQSDFECKYTQIYEFVKSKLQSAPACHDFDHTLRVLRNAEKIAAELPKAEHVGFVFPVYAMGPPRLVSRFLEQVSLDTSSYVFIVMTYAGKSGATGKISSSGHPGATCSLFYAPRHRS
jgi:putative NADPH-quinone reductase